MSHHNMYFAVVVLHRDDFADVGYDARGLSDEDMRTIAADLGAYIFEKVYVGYHNELIAHASARNLPPCQKRTKKPNSYDIIS